MRCDVLAIGTELLLGQIVDTNSAWIGEQLAASGIDSYEHRAIGDNQARIVAALRDLLARSDAVLVCGGLGPTQDDLTRDAIAEVMGVPLVRRDELAEAIAQMFRARVRDMPQNNLRQADVPEGGDAIPNPIGTAPGLLCALPGDKVVYAVPGVPYEMQQMVRDHVIPDLLRRSGEAAAIVSRSLKTWGTSESALAEMVAHRLDALDAGGGNPTIAFLARGIEGLVVRVTAKAATEADARALVDLEEKELRLVLGADVGIAATGVAGPTEQDGVAVGTVYFGLAIPGLPTEAVSTRLPGDRERLRQFSTISLLNLLRQRLDVLGTR